MPTPNARPDVWEADPAFPDPAGYSQLSAGEQAQILALQQEILAAAASGLEVSRLVERVCRLEERLLPNSVASVMLLEPGGRHLDVYAAPSVPVEGRARLNGLRPGPGAGSCGNAVFRREPVFVANTFTDPRWQDLRQVAVDFNICACWSMPIRVGREVVGSFALSSFEHREPGPFHRSLLEIGAAVVGIALQRGRSEDTLRLSAKVFEGSEQGIMVTDAARRILTVNRAFTKVTGYAEADVHGRTPGVLASGRHDRAFYDAMWHSIRHFGHWHGEIWNRRKDGEVYPQRLGISAVTDDDGEVSHYIGLFSDLSENKAAEARIAYLSTHDELTDLPNRQLFKEKCQLAMRMASRAGAKLALLYVDLDHFKLLNDSLGHGTGDNLLRALAARLRGLLGEGDLLGRPGGDEFMVALTDLSGGGEGVDAVSDTAQRIIDALSRPLDLQDHPIALSCSIGISIYPDDGDDFDTLLKQADSAMYHAKDAGRNAFHFFTESMNVDALAHLQMAGALRQAVERREFELYYQPQFDLVSGRLFGAEALIRWHRPDEGMVSPARFIPLAEQSGLIVPIGAWALEEVCRQGMAWRAQGLPELVLGVNLSAVQFQRGDIVETVQAALAATGFPAACLELEITESVMAQDVKRTLARIQRLKALGVWLAIDDFGTGYSSLAYLRQFKVDRLKIDQSFIRDMVGNPDAAAIVAAITQMAAALNLRTIAEGVETAEHVDHLRQCRCEAVQGYHFARPMPAADFARFVATRLG